MIALALIALIITALVLASAWRLPEDDAGAEDRRG